MSGATAVQYLLGNNAPVVAVVPSERILDDDPEPAKPVFPLITIDVISSMPYNLIRSDELPRMHTDRVQVTAQFKGQFGKPAGTGKAGCTALLRLVLTALPGQGGTIGGVLVDSIVPDILGPALHDYTDDLWTRSRDFFVNWIEPA